MPQGFRARFEAMGGPRILYGAMVAVCGLCTVWYLLFRWIGDGGRMLGYFNAGGYWFGVAAAFATIAFAALRRFGEGAAALVLAALILWPVGSGIPWRSFASVEGVRIRVVTASLRSANTDMAEAGARLATLDPNILIVQEVSDIAGFTAAIGRSGRWHIAHAGPQLIASRWPTRARHVFSDLLEAEIETPAGRITVWNVRAPKSFEQTSINTLYYATLAERIDAAGGKGIAAGDFNATPWNDGYRSVAALLNDGYARAGWGSGFTFPARGRRIGILPAFARIDHVFADARLVPVGARTVQASPQADHLPVVVDYVVRPGS